MKLSYEQARALDLLKRPDPHGDVKTAETHGGETWADNYTVWLNYRTALALERRGLVKIDKAMDGWDVYLAEHIDGSRRANEEGGSVEA